MMRVARAASTLMLFFVKLPAPFVSGVSPLASPVFTTMLPDGAVPTTPSWMWEIVMVVVDGKPCRLHWKLAVAAVIVPAASFVRLNVIVTVPLPVASAPVIGGTSWFEKIAIEKITGRFDGCGVGLSSPQAAPPTMATAINSNEIRFIGPLFLPSFSEELPRQVEAEKERVGKAAPRDLAERRR
jgi:hypothetical protein